MSDGLRTYRLTLMAGDNGNPALEVSMSFHGSGRGGPASWLPEHSVVSSWQNISAASVHVSDEAAAAEIDKMDLLKTAAALEAAARQLREWAKNEPAFA